MLKEGCQLFVGVVPPSVDEEGGEHAIVSLSGVRFNTRNLYLEPRHRRFIAAPSRLHVFGSSGIVYGWLGRNCSIGRVVHRYISQLTPHQLGIRIPARRRVT